MVCKKEFKPNNESVLFCSIECTKKHLPKQKGIMRSQFKNCKASHSTKGAISELKVASDLLRKGYSVFRALSPGASCDLVIICPDNLLKRVEVRSAVKYTNGDNRHFYSKKGNYDVIASVFNNEIRYDGL